MEISYTNTTSPRQNDDDDIDLNTSPRQKSVFDAEGILAVEKGPRQKSVLAVHGVAYIHTYMHTYIPANGIYTILRIMILQARC